MKRPMLLPLLVGLVSIVPVAVTPAAQASSAAPTRMAASSTTVSPEVFESRLLALANHRRATHGCRAVRLHSALIRAARLHSSRMSSRGDLSHRLAGEGDLAARAVAAGYTNWRILAENLAWGQQTPLAVFRAWVASPGHRANLDNCRLRDVGFGVVISGGRPWVTADYGRRAS